MYILRYTHTPLRRLGRALNIMKTDFYMQDCCCQSAQRRIYVLCRILKSSQKLRINYVNGTHSAELHSIGEGQVKIGDVSKSVKEPKVPQYVPTKYLEHQPSQEVLSHMRWMLQKDVLGQDMFLIGRPGPLRRRLVMRYLELTGREAEYVALSRDTTEADLKQRREIRAGTAHYFDQSAVRAAVEGRVLILEGIEKAERNVLPVLNNLLENREMRLEDGRFLIPAQRYDRLLKEHGKEEMDRWQLVRVNEDFRVVALGLPTPRYAGNPLDPPLRSRFQARHVDSVGFQEQLSTLRSFSPDADHARLSQLLSSGHALLTGEAATLGLPDFPVESLNFAATLMSQYPWLPNLHLLYRLYPYRLFLPDEGCSAVEDILRTFQLLEENQEPELDSQEQLEDVAVSKEPHIANIRLRSDQHVSEVQVMCGDQLSKSSVVPYQLVPTPYQESLVAAMAQSHSAGADLCLVGPRGCGKSAAVHRLASLLQYQIEPVLLYQDMTSRDLVQQRTTLPSGDTIWRNSSLVNAALQGKLAVLDGLHRLHPSTLAVLHRLVQDRELTLFDGRRLIRHDRYDQYKQKYGLSDDQLTASGVLKVHPAFRVVAIAEPPILRGASGGPQWLSSELLSLFLFHQVRPLAAHEELHIMSELYGAGTNREVVSIVQLAHRLREATDPTLKSLSASLSTRQLLRIARRLAQYPNDSPRSAIEHACLSRFLPPLARQLLERTLNEAGFPPDEQIVLEDGPPPTCEVSADGSTVRIGKTVAQRYHGAAVSQVPDVLFFDIPQHVRALEWLLQDFELGEHLLLVGNQGVGKNKLADRLLQLLGRPRQYIQLHRDTTVQTLTLQPTVREGVVTYEDSPLVTAARFGHVLVVDEADKAPTHVTCILKTLVETGEMALSDGRRIAPAWDSQVRDPSIVPMHPDFRMIVLANRPGFPFLGNDFFGALGDLFSCHAVDNPSPQSETSLLKMYGPNVPEDIITRLVRAFGELRSMADRGLLQYPYSTREVVNIVKHLQEFPEEGLASVVRNVFDFDHYSQEAQETVLQTLIKHGIPVGANPGNVHLAKEFPLSGPRVVSHWTKSTDSHHLRVQERPLRTFRPNRIPVHFHALDLVQARGTAFSELFAYWPLPMQPTSFVAGLAVTLDPEGESTRDWVHALLSNPLSLMSMQPLGGDGHVQEISLQGILSPVRGARARYSLAALRTTADYILLHEQSSNGAVLVDRAAGEVHHVALSSGAATEDRSGLLGLVSGSAGPTRWKMLPELLPVHHTAVFYEVEGDRAEVVNFENLTSYSIRFPVKIHSLHIASPDHWLLEDVDDRQFLATGTPCPTELVELHLSGNHTSNTLAIGIGSLPVDKLSQVLGRTGDADVIQPCRLMATTESAATLAVAFPGPSRTEILSWGEAPNRVLGAPIVYADRGQIIRAVSPTQVPNELRQQGVSPPAAFLEVTDIISATQRYIPVPQSSTAVSPMASWMYSTTEPPLYLAAKSDGGLATLDASGCVQIWEVSLISLNKSIEQWRKMIGPGREHLQMTVDRPSGKDVTAPKHGRVDETGAPHVGGNTWAGGTGGRDTAGLGGKGGPYRLDAGHPVHQVTQEEKDAVPEHIKKAAREMGRRAFQQRLREIQMSEYDAKLYAQFSDSVSHQVQMLRVMLSGLQARAKERQWVRHQTAGELDDTKLIEGLTGEKTIFRRRADMDPEPGSPQTKPKRLRIVVDVSGSMYRFNSYDGRLDRELEAVVMVMEAFEGHQDRIQYDIVGHSGEEFDLLFVDHKAPPADNKKKLDIIKTMHAHSQFCMSGDHTLEATRKAVESLSREDCDEAVVVVLSDANLERYGIRPERFTAALTSHPTVGAYAIFIGSLGDQAERLTKSLPAGRAFVCLDLKNIPQILQQIFSSSVLSGR